MNGDGFDDTRKEGDQGSWATESLPLAVRREMLERELRKLGFRRRDAHPSSSMQQQQQPQSGGSSHPQADGHGDGDQHGD